MWTILYLLKVNVIELFAAKFIFFLPISEERKVLQKLVITVVASHNPTEYEGEAARCLPYGISELPMGAPLLPYFTRQELYLVPFHGTCNDKPCKLYTLNIKHIFIYFYILLGCDKCSAPPLPNLRLLLYLEMTEALERTAAIGVWNFAIP